MPALVACFSMLRLAGREFIHGIHYQTVIRLNVSARLKPAYLPFSSSMPCSQSEVLHPLGELAAVRQAGRELGVVDRCDVDGDVRLAGGGEEEDPLEAAQPSSGSRGAARVGSQNFSTAC